MDYEELILSAFERDLAERRDAGVSDVVFQGETARHRSEGDFHEAAGMPPEIVALCVRLIFGEKVSDPAIWRGYRMSAATLITSITPFKAIHILNVRLTKAIDHERS